MKKLFILVLLFMGTLTTVRSQVFTFDYSTSGQSRTDQTFRRQMVGSGRKTFSFRSAAGNRMLIEVSSLRQVDSLPQLDSVVEAVWQALVRTGDTATDDLQSVRVDAVFLPNDLRLHTQRYPQQGQTYRVQAGEVTQLKVEQDTLTLNLYTRRGNSLTGLQPFRVSFLVNRLADARRLAAQPGLQTALQRLRADLAPLKNDRTADFPLSRYTALYDAITGERVVPRKGGAIRPVGRLNTVQPYVQASLQYLRGSWVPSAGVGLVWSRRPNELFKSQYALLWEPHFVSDPAKATRLLRNDFVTFRVHQSSKFKSVRGDVDFTQNFSVGYLVHRSGDFFRPHTFAFTVPGLQFKNAMLEPGGYFNRLFKNFSPTLRLTLYVE